MSNDACINNSRKVIFNIGSIGITGRIDVYPSSIDCSSLGEIFNKKKQFRKNFHNFPNITGNDICKKNIY